MKAEDIVGLTQQEIQNKFALPNILYLDLMVVDNSMI